MIIIEIENTNIIDGSAPNKKEKGERWYFKSQNALLFMDGEKYPHHFELSLGFSGVESELTSIQPVSVGRYELLDIAFYVDQKKHLQIDPLKLKLHVKK